MFITNITRLFVIDAINESGTENYDDLKCEMINRKRSRIATESPETRHRDGISKEY